MATDLLTVGREPTRAPASPLTWPRVGVIVAVAAVLAASLGFRAGLNTRVAHPLRLAGAPTESAAPPASGVSRPGVSADVNTALDVIEDEARGIVLAPDVRIVVEKHLSISYDFWPSVDGHVVTIPGVFAARARDAEVLAWAGAMRIAFREQVEAQPYVPSSIACLDAFRLLSAAPASRTITVGKVADVLWIESYAHRPIKDSDVLGLNTVPAVAEFEDYFASTLTVLRFYHDAYAKRLAALGPRDRALVRGFERSVAEAFSGAAADNLRRAIADLPAGG